MPEHQHVTLIKQSGIFDEHYYRHQLDSLDPLSAASAAALSFANLDELVEHYLLTGASLGLNPHPLFRTNFYLERNVDVASSCMNPLVHYLMHGAHEGRLPNQYFDSAFYLASITDSAKFGVNPLSHYLNSQVANKLATHAQFDTQTYLGFYPEILISAIDPLTHYLNDGLKQKRLAYLEFDPAFYLKTYSDVAAAGLDPFQHYKFYGRAEGRLPRSANGRFDDRQPFRDLLTAGSQSVHCDSVASPFAAHDRFHYSTRPRVFWGHPLFETRFIDQFYETVKRLPDVTICVHQTFLRPHQAQLPKNVVVSDAVTSLESVFAECSILIAPQDNSPVSGLMLAAIESELLVVCSDDCELSQVLSPSEASMLPQGIDAVKISHAISYAFANSEDSAQRARAARSRLVAERTIAQSVTF